MHATTDQAKRIWFSVALAAPIAAFQVVRIARSRREAAAFELTVTMFTFIVIAFVAWRVVRQFPKAPSFTHPLLIGVVIVVCILTALELLH
jgi:hypothetical protein